MGSIGVVDGSMLGALSFALQAFVFSIIFWVTHQWIVEGTGVINTGNKKK